RPRRAAYQVRARLASPSVDGGRGRGKPHPYHRDTGVGRHIGPTGLSIASRYGRFSRADFRRASLYSTDSRNRSASAPRGVAGSWGAGLVGLLAEKAPMVPPL